MKARYEYLPDGSKLSALAGSGAGHKYRGSFVYSVDSSGNEKLESVACDEGRLSVTYNSSGAVSYRDDWHVRDYLGNTRLVVNITSTSTPPSTGILEKSDYLPFGTRVATSSTPLNRWRQSGKEEQVIGGNDLGVLDFGARHYDPWLARWTTQDPMAVKYLNFSPYSYCGNNPIILVDPDGSNPFVYYLLWKVVGNAIEIAPVNNTIRSFGYAMNHPINALKTGMVGDEFAWGISSYASNFQVNLQKQAGFSEDEGGEGNAYRHALWQAMLTRDFGPKQAFRIGNAHENAVPKDLNQRIFEDMSKADRMVDILNNMIGRSIGSENKLLDNKEMAKKILKVFRDSGLWLVEQKDANTFIIKKEKLSSEKFEAGMVILDKKGNNGLNFQQ